MADSIDYWRLGDPSMIARVIPKENLADRYIYQKKFNVKPGEAAIWITNGRLEKILTEGQGIASGVMDRLKSKFGAGQDMVLVMMDVSSRVLQFTSGVDRDTIHGNDPAFYKKILDAYQEKTPTPRRYDEDHIGEMLDLHHAQTEAEKKDEEFRRIEQKGEQVKEEEGNRRKEEIWYRQYQDRVEEQLDNRIAILTKDRESVVFDVRAVISLDPGRGEEIFKLLKGQDFLNEESLKNMISKELEARVFGPEIAKYSATELRSNVEIIASIHNHAETELFRWLDNYGVQLSRISINPAITDAERAAVIDKEKEALAEAAKRHHERNLRAGQLEYDLLLQKENLAAALEKAKDQNQQEIQAIAAAALLDQKGAELSEAEFDEKIKQLREETRLQAKAKEQYLEFLGIERNWEIERQKMVAAAEKELERLRAESTMKIEEQKAAGDIEIETLRAHNDEYRKNKALKIRGRIAEIEAKKAVALEEQQHVERVLEIGSQQGVLDGGVLSDVLHQATLRKALDQGDKAAQAFAMAEGQRHDKETFKDGLKAAPPIGVAGQGRIFMQTIPQGQGGPPNLVMGPQIGQTGQTGAGSEPIKLIDCPHCGQKLPEDSKFCGNCGIKLQN